MRRDVALQYARELNQFNRTGRWPGGSGGGGGNVYIGDIHIQGTANMDERTLKRAIEDGVANSLRYGRGGAIVRDIRGSR